MLLAGGVTTIVDPKNRDWLALTRKIERGTTLEEALEQAGIPFEEFEEHMKARMGQVQMDDVLLHMTAGYAIKVGVQALAQIVANGPRFAESEKDGAGGTRTLTPLSVDLDAAKALVAFGLKARSMTGVKTLKITDPEGKPAGQLDLWDVAALGPWKDLKNPADQS